MRVADRTFPNIVFRIFNSVCLFLLTVLLSRIAGPENFGILSLFILNATFLNLFTSFGSDSGITFHIANMSVRVSSIITYIIGIVALQIIFAGVIGLAFYLSGNLEFLVGSMDSGYVWLFCLLVSISIIEKYTALLNGSQLYTIFSRTALVSNLLFIVTLIIILSSRSLPNAKSIIAIYIGFSVLQAVLLVVIFHRKVKDSFPDTSVSSAILKQISTYSLIAYMANIFQFLAYRMDLWIIRAYWSEDDVGIYALATRFAQLLWIIPLVHAALLFPKVSGSQGGVKHHGILTAVRLVNTFNVIIVIVSIVLVSWLLPIFSGGQYKESILPFLILLPGVFCFSITIILASYFAGVNKLRVNLYGSIACFFIILVLDFLLIPKYGVGGAAIATSVGYIIVGIYTVAKYIRDTREPVADMLLLRQNDFAILSSAVRRFLSLDRQNS